MNRVYSDSNNVRWQMFDTEPRGRTGPSYAVPAQCHLAIRQYMKTHIGATQSSYHEIPLPYFSIPMWIVDEQHVDSILNYLYCVCCTCGITLNTPAQLILLFTIGIDTAPWLTMTWRVGLRGMCCSPNLIRNNTYYHFMLHSQNALTPAIESGWDVFNPVIDPACLVFSCDHDICRFTKKLITENSLYTTPDDHMNDLLGYFLIIKLDVVGPLLTSSSKCARKTCGIPLKYAKENRIMCDNCRRIMYCSDECIEMHHCDNYCNVWLLQ